MQAACSSLLAGNEAPLERVWQATRVWIPATPAVSGRRTIEVERALAAVPAGTRLPSVVYVHGCHGLDDDLAQWATVLTGAGYALFALDSAARGERPPVCTASTLYVRADQPRFSQREAEVRYALRQMRTFSWLAPESVFLMGFDHGGVVAAGWRERGFAGIVITGWTCTAPDVRGGLFTPLDRPVLAIRWADDPLFRDPAWNGDCEAHLGGRPASRSLVLDGQGHSTAPSAEARAAVLGFLRANTSR